MEYDPDLVERLHRAFDARPRRNSNLRFETLLEAFGAESCNMADIARANGLSRKTIHGLYRVFFEPIFGKSGLELRRERERRASQEMSLDALRVRYERMSGMRTKIRLSYDDLLALFRNPETDFSGIAQSLGVANKTVGSYYRKYFQPVMGMSGQERLETNRQAVRDDMVRELSGGKGVLGIVTRAAEEAGLTVRRTPKLGRRFELRERGLLIEGILCRVHHLRYVRRVSRRSQRYLRASFPRSRKVPYEAHLICMEVSENLRRILVVPSYVINAVPGSQKYVKVFIPLHRRPIYHNIRPRIDWLKYENAWHLLEGEDE